MASKSKKKITDESAAAPDDAVVTIGSLTLGEQLEVLNDALGEQQGTSLVELLNQLAHTRGVGVKLD
jgi:hypothetical protein